jgi:hypothetical protein
MLWFVAMDCVVSSAVIHSMETDAGLHVNYATFVLKCCRLVSLSLLSYSTLLPPIWVSGYGCGASKVVIIFVHCLLVL